MKNKLRTQETPDENIPISAQTLEKYSNFPSDLQNSVQSSQGKPGSSKERCHIKSAKNLTKMSFGNPVAQHVQGAQTDRNFTYCPSFQMSKAEPHSILDTNPKTVDNEQRQYKRNLFQHEMEMSKSKHQEQSRNQKVRISEIFL